MASKSPSGATERTRRAARRALSRDTQQFDAQTPIMSLPQDVMNLILSDENLPDPNDLSRLRSVNRAMRDAVAATGREIMEYVGCI